MLRPFHLAIPVRDIESTRNFYVEALGCTVGRESGSWIDFNFFGHQVSAHVHPDELSRVHTNPVDGEDIPVRHFGLVLEWDAWHTLVDKLRKKEIAFLIEPTLRFMGKAGEQATFFVLDPSGNALEFKSFRDDRQLFAQD
jgi:extradiol dioxygenase family protein